MQFSQHWSDNWVSSKLFLSSKTQNQLSIQQWSAVTALNIDYIELNEIHRKYKTYIGTKKRKQSSAVSTRARSNQCENFLEHFRFAFSFSSRSLHLFLFLILLRQVKITSYRRSIQLAAETVTSFTHKNNKFNDDDFSSRLPIVCYVQEWISWRQLNHSLIE